VNNIFYFPNVVDIVNDIIVNLARFTRIEISYADTFAGASCAALNASSVGLFIISVVPEPPITIG
jgi:hypothetical protein